MDGKEIILLRQDLNEIVNKIEILSAQIGNHRIRELYRKPLLEYMERLRIYFDDDDGEESTIAGCIRQSTGNPLP